MKAELVPENGDRPIPIVRDVTVVGRREYCDVVIDHPSLSKRHCIFVKTEGLLVIRDLATTNGTKVKGQKVRWAALLPDDRISLGSYKLRIYLGPDDMPSPSEQARARGQAGGRRPVGDGMPGRPPAGPTGTWVQSEPSAASQGPTAPGFPEPSRSEIPARPALNPTRPAANHRDAATVPPAQEDFQFEILDDDDEEIIDLG